MVANEMAGGATLEHSVECESKRRVTDSGHRIRRSLLLLSAAPPQLTSGIEGRRTDDGC
jgi:hypothetical protein